MSKNANQVFKYVTKAYLLTAKTNLHAGAGSESYGVIDNLIQRDLATNLPTINATSLKGAIREYFEDGFSERDADLVKYVFGGGPKNAPEDASSGKYRFFSADLLSIPIRSDKKMYVNLTCKRIAKHVLDMHNILKTGIQSDMIDALKEISIYDLKKDKAHHFETVDAILLEENDITAVKGPLLNKMTQARMIFGQNLVIADDDTFTELTNNLHLPVVARNQLNNGISENLWYEQILPRETRLWFPVQYPNDVKNSFFKSFDEQLKENLVQVGANASVGYGYCDIKDF